MDLAPPPDGTGPDPSPSRSRRERWLRAPAWTREPEGHAVLTTPWTVAAAGVALIVCVLVQIARFAGLHDLGSGGTWLLLQTVPGFAVCVWVRDLRASSMLLFSWVGSATIVTGVGMAMALSSSWHPSVAYAVIGGLSLLSLLAFVILHRIVGLPTLSPRNLVSPTSLGSVWLALLGVLICIVSTPSRPAGPVRAGLVGTVYPTWFLGLACIVASFAIAVHRRVRPWASVMSASIVVVTSQAIAYGLPALPSAAHHVGLIRFIQTSHEVKPSLDIYQAWSGMFAGQAWTISAGGIRDPFIVATWWPILAMAAEALAVRVLAGRILDAQRAWIAGGVFALGNTLNTVYFAPQVLAFAPGIAIIALLLAPPRGESPRRARLRVWAVLPIACAVVVQHQITPFIVFVALVVLVLFRVIRPWWSPLLVLVPTLTWTFINLDVLRAYVEPGALGDVIANIAPPEHPPSAITPPQITTLTFTIPGYALAVVGLIAVLKLIRVRDRMAWVLAIAAASPVALSLGTDYGGEGIFRITLFALPWLAILALRDVPDKRLGAAAVLRRLHLATPVVAVAAGAMLAVAVLGQTGMDWARVVRPGAVEADAYYERTAPKGSMLLDLGTQNAAPAAQAARYPDVFYTSRDLIAAPGTTGYPTQVGAAYDAEADLRAVTKVFLRQEAPAHYLFVSDQIGAYDERYGNQTFADFEKLAAAVRRSPEWRIVKRTNDAELYQHVGKK